MKGRQGGQVTPCTQWWAPWIPGSQTRPQGQGSRAPTGPLVSQQEQATGPGSPCCQWPDVFGIPIWLCSWALGVPTELPLRSASRLCPWKEEGEATPHCQPSEAGDQVFQAGDPLAGAHHPKLPPLPVWDTPQSVTAPAWWQTGPLEWKAQGHTHSPWPSSRGSSKATSRGWAPNTSLGCMCP